MNAILAYAPLIDPIDAHDWWWALVLPMTIFVSIAYKAVRASDMSRYPREVATMTVQVLVGMAALGIAFYLIVQLLIPLLAPAPEF